MKCNDLQFLFAGPISSDQLYADFACPDGWKEEKLTYQACYTAILTNKTSGFNWYQAIEECSKLDSRSELITFSDDEFFWAEEIPYLQETFKNLSVWAWLKEKGKCF